MLFSPEQREAYAAQIAEEKLTRAQMPKGENTKELIEHLRQDAVEAHRIKFGLGPVLSSEVQA